MKTTKKMLIIIVFAVMLYTVASFVLAFRGIEISPTLTGVYFAFWGTEVVAMASITKTKHKHPSTSEEEIECEEGEESE